MNPPNLKELAERIAVSVRHLRCLLQQIEWHIPKATVWAFGSRVKWSYRPESDLDLAVHCDKKTAQKALPKLNYAFDESDLPFKVQIADFNRLPANMQENIKKDYIVLYHPTEKPLPTEWKETTLGEAASFSQGIQVPAENQFTKKKPDYVRFVRIVDYTNQEEVPRYIENPGEKYFVNKDDLVMIRYGSQTAGKIVRGIEGVIANNTFKITPQEFVDKNYLYWFLRQADIYNYLNKDQSSSTMPAITFTQVSNLQFTLLPLPEQKAIAAILSSFDDKIELLRRQNKTLESIAQTIFKEWFVKFNVPVEFKVNSEKLIVNNGRKEAKREKLKINSKTGLPEGWRMGKLGDEFEIIMGQSPDGKSYNESGEGMIFFQGRAEFQERFPVTRLYTTEPKRLAEKFDVLVSVRAPVGDINVAFDKCCIGRGLGAVRGKYKSYALYKIKSLKDAFDKFEDEGTVFGSIGKDSFANIEVIIPDSEIVKAFEAVAGSIDAKIYNNYLQIQTLSKLRDTLLPKLMKGEIRVMNNE